MFSRILIANRGEIALRVIRACRELGIQAVAAYSEADRDAAYLSLADDAICIGPANPADSYLNISRIISAAEVANVQAIHPGYGFLAEDAHFAEVCRSCNIEFIGPSPETLALLGDKVAARRLAKKAGVPVIPGSDAVVEDEDQAVAIAAKLGYPVMIKAAGGGGGRGMRIAHNDMSLRANLKAARSEAEAAFGNPDVYIEKFLEAPRHVEVQILADNAGHIVHLWERDCTLQRRYQKLVEETPSPGISDNLRQRICEAAVKIARAAKYSNAGTIEFLVNGRGRFYFSEVNARVQVEHPVTEMVTGIDIVKWQLRIAGGERLNIRQRDVRQQGVAVECRINAEDPDNGFSPSPGRLEVFQVPGGPGVRVDTHAYAGYTIPPNYDSLLAKLIVHQRTRSEAIACMKRALEEFRIGPIKTTIPLHREIFSHTHFIKGKVDTGFIERTW